MKKSLLLFLLLPAFLFIQCAEDEDTEGGEVLFSFNTHSVSNGRELSAIPDGSSIIISLKKSNGQNQLSFYPVELLKFGDSFISTPLPLPQGRYTIEDFLVSINDQVLFATPKKGSKFSSLVSNPLPISVVVKPNESSTITMDVIDVTYQEPEDLGYAAFNLNVIHPLRITALAYGNGGFNPVHATFALELGDSVLMQSNLLPRSNLLSFTGDHLAMYKLRVSKDGYQDAHLDFCYATYLDESGSGGLQVILEPKNVLSFSAMADPLIYLTFIRSGSILIDWDGATEEIAFQPFSSDPDGISFHQVTHQLPEIPGTVKIRGDVDQIVEFVSVTPLDRLDLSKMNGLQNLTLENSTMQILDLSSNVSLASLAFINTNVTMLLMPRDHRLDNILIEGTTGQTMQFPVDLLIEKIHANALKENILEGAFIMFNAGEITPESALKLEELQNAYSWYVEIE